MSTYQLNIDGTSAEQGAKRIVKSFDDIKAAADRMEKGASGSFSAMSKAFKALSDMSGIRRDFINNFRDFTQAINSFKGPSQANLANTQRFFKFLEGIKGFKAPSSGGLKAFLEPLSNFKGPGQQATANVRVLLKAMENFKSPSSAGLGEFLAKLSNFKGPSQASSANVKTLLNALVGFKAPSVGQLGGFLSALSSYKGPSQASAKNTASLLRSLSGFTNAPRSTSSFNAFLATLGSYKGPTATAGRNTLSLLQALATFQPPRNISNTVKGFADLANAIDRAANSMTRLRQGAKGNLSTPNFKAHSAGIRQLGTNYGFLETAVLRTQTALNAIGGVLGVKIISDAANAVVKIRSQLEAATGSAQQSRVQFAFLQQETERLGLEFTTTAKSYGMLLGSIKGTNVTFAEAQKIFLGFSTAARALQLSTDDVDGIFRALGQIMSKGKLQAEELRGQLGDRLPGAFVRFAKALDMTKPGELDDALKKGAISGDRLKKAILEVASTLETEFAPSADKASKTVDAAFNRLKNSFTFSADTFGQNGFNQFLISVADGLRKLAESSAVNTALSGLAKILQVVGNNIEFVASLIAGSLLASFLKWATAAATATRAVIASNAAITALTVATKGWTALQMWVGLGNVGVAASRATVAWRALNVVMAANVFGLVAVGLTAVVYGLSQMSAKSAEAEKALAGSASGTADATNFLEAYIARIYDSSKAIDDQTGKLNNNTLAVLNNARAKAGDITYGKETNTRNVLGLDFWDVPGIFGGKKKTVLGGNALGFGGKAVDDKLAKILKPLTTNRGGKIGQRVPTNAKEFEAFARATGNLEGYLQVNPDAASAVGNILQNSRNVLGNIQQTGTQKGNNLGYDPSAILQKIVGGDYNGTTQPPGISGEAPEKKNKNKNRGANQYRNAVQSAIDALSDLDTKAVATQRLIDSVSNGALDSVAGAARAQAVMRVEDFEQAFRGENIKKRQQGIIDIAKAMNLQASSYDVAKQSLISYYAAAEERQARLDNDRKTQDSITSLREENDIRERYVDAIRLGGDALAQANIQMEVEKQLLNGSTENREKLTQQLTEQLQKQLALNRAEKAAEEMNTYARNARVNSQIAGTYGLGLNPSDLADAQEMIRYHDELNEAYGKDSPYVQFFLDLKLAAQANESALKRAAEQYDAIRTVSEDVASAIADALGDAFKNGYSEGESFKRKFKNLFKDLKDIILDFVLFNPLKKFLADSLTGIFTSSFGTNRSAAVSSSSASIADMTYSGGNMIGQILNSFGSPNKSMSATTAGERASEQRDFATSVGQAIGSEIPVIGSKSTTKAQEAVQQPQGLFSSFKKIFDYKTNGSALKEGLSDLGSVFKGANKGFGASLDKLGKGIGKVGQAAGAAFAAYETGSGVAKMLGLGKGGQKIAGFASAGFSLGGPIGAAIGATVGAAFAIFGKKKTPSTWGNVSVGENGATNVSAGKYGKGDLAVGQAMGNAGASLFSNFAYGYGSTLAIGDYGSFGRRKIKNDGVKGESLFYSTQGTTSKGKPAGVKGVDWISSADEGVIQAFALIKQIQAGKFTGLDPVYKTIANNTSYNAGIDTLQSNLAVGTGYLDFIDSAKIQTDVQKQIDQLNKSFKTLSQQSKALGLDTNRLDKAYQKLLKTYKEQFDNDIDQQILEITDPLKAAYNSLLTEYQDTVANAMAVGGDLADVEKLYGLKRAELAKQYAEEANNGIVKMAKDLLTQLTASSSSPLSPNEVLKNAQTDFETLRKEILGGNFTNADKLQEYAGNYLDAARATGKSSYDYFQIFDEVTNFLKMVQDANAITTPENLPELPGVQTLVDKISKQNDDLNATTQSVGAAILDGNASAEEIGQQTNQLLSGIYETLQNGYTSNSLNAILRSTNKTPSL